MFHSSISLSLSLSLPFSPLLCFLLFLITSCLLLLAESGEGKPEHSVESVQQRAGLCEFLCEEGGPSIPAGGSAELSPRAGASVPQVGARVQRAVGQTVQGRRGAEFTCYAAICVYAFSFDFRVP